MIVQEQLEGLAPRANENRMYIDVVAHVALITNMLGAPILTKHGNAVCPKWINVSQCTQCPLRSYRLGIFSQLLPTN